MRVTQTTLLDCFLLTATSILLGAYLGMYRHEKSHSSKACAASYVGGIGGFLGFACQICNRILVMLLGLAGVVMYVELVRYALGLIGVAVMAYAIAEESKAI